MTLKEAYKKGFLDGLEAFAWPKDGRRVVGGLGMMTLSESQRMAEAMWNYSPPTKEDEQKFYASMLQSDLRQLIDSKLEEDQKHEQLPNP